MTTPEKLRNWRDTVFPAGELCIDLTNAAAEIERLEAKVKDLEAMRHSPDCDINDKNPDGIAKPCNCGLERLEAELIESNRIMSADAKQIFKLGEAKAEADKLCEWTLMAGQYYPGCRPNDTLGVRYQQHYCEYCGGEVRMK